MIQDQLLRFIRRRNALSIATLEREANLPKDTIAKALLIDLDPQGNLSQIFDVDIQDEKQVYTSLVKLQDLPSYQVADNLYICPSDIELSKAETELINKVGGEQRLKILISRLSENYDFILIDCPPSLNILTMSAMQASNSCLITLLPEMSALKGLNTLLERVSEARQIFNPSWNCIYHGSKQ